MTLDQQLGDGLNALDITIESGVQEVLVEYLQLLAKWNRAYNLTAVRDPKQMVTRHILDSLSIVKHVKGDFILDIGSGAGLPGIPLALCLPDYDFTLLDSNGKKTRFMTQAVKDLGIDNVSVIKARVEDYEPDVLFDTVVARAFSSIINLVRESVHLCKPKGQILSMKGTYPVAELDELPSTNEMVEVLRLDVPGVSAERHLAIVQCAMIPDNISTTNS
ncbi:16S rRNA (guanine(527)-N(7))-methyltransferase [hydrothermal vent metagenome]|uniref:16S rRNA (Guanine(527)-N(7))-methyltransferase n=1 Tax=hydrothermal vent metagenome TaxID=652676 RepID=A0A3B0ZCH6_9ZZZZ